MSSQSVDQIMGDVQAPSPQEHRALRDRIDGMLDVESQESERAREPAQRLMQTGLLSRIPPGIADPGQYRNRRRVTIQGPPLSQTIIEER